MAPVLEARDLFWYHTFVDLGLDIYGVENRDHVAWKADAIPSDLTGKSVLDIGTWDGYYAFLCERRGATRVLAVDNLAHGQGIGAFSYAKEELRSTVEFKQADIRELASLKETFDLVLYMGVYYHMPDPYLGFKNMSQLTRDMAVVEGAYEDATESYMRWMIGSHPDPSYFWRPTLPCLKDLLSHVGFRTVDVVSFKQDRALLRAKKSG